MPELSRAQIAVYGGIAVAVLLVGARWVRAADAPAESGSPQPMGFEADRLPAGGEGSGDVVVHVAGAVKRPGVYRMPAGSRVADAVARAGGVAPGALADAINLAARLSDGQQVVVPSRTAAGAPGGPPVPDGPISLGSATAEQLEEIEGIGPVTAAAIIAFRDERGGVSSIEQLDEVSGIGPATLDALRDRLAP